MGETDHGVVRKAIESTQARVALGVLAILGFLTRGDISHALSTAYDKKWILPAAITVIAASIGGAWFLSVRGSVKVITTNADLQHHLRLTVQSAKKKLYCVGSRSRDRDYLDLIEDVFRERSKLEHTRVLYGPPAHAVLKNHLDRMWTFRNHEGAKQVSVGLVSIDDCEDPEQTLCASEKRAVIVIPAMGVFGRHDSAVVLTRKKQVATALQYVESLHSSSEVLSAGQVKALSTTRTKPVASPTSSPVMEDA